jgi:predicted Zn-ribbon and HTH transcriptional regulator
MSKNKWNKLNKLQEAYRIAINSIKEKNEENTVSMTGKEKEGMGDKEPIDPTPCSQCGEKFVIFMRDPKNYPYKCMSCRGFKSD